MLEVEAVCADFDFYVQRMSCAIDCLLQMNPEAAAMYTEATAEQQQP